MAQCGKMPATKHDHMSSISRTHGRKGKFKKKNLRLGKGNLSKITDYCKFPIHFEDSLQLNYFFFIPFLVTVWERKKPWLILSHQSSLVVFSASSATKPIDIMCPRCHMTRIRAQPLILSPTNINTDQVTIVINWDLSSFSKCPLSTPGEHTLIKCYFLR